MVENSGSRIAISSAPSFVSCPPILLLVAGFFAILGCALSFALDVPPLRARVNDRAGMLSPQAAQALEQRLADFERATGHQIAVLTVPSLKGDAIEDFGIRVAEAWKIGKKGFDNGAILIIAQEERRLRIEVGYGLEGVLPDAIASRIIREVIVPRFRAGDFSGGIVAGVNAILQVTQGEPLPESARAVKSTSSRGESLLTVLTITAMVALFIGMTQRRVISGMFGGSAAGLLAALASSAGLGLVLLVLALIVGAILGAVGSSLGPGSAANQWTGGSRYRRGGWGGGLFPGGFGGGGGGFGGGGFSGGGGGFGGGGASGSW